MTTLRKVVEVSSNLRKYKVIQKGDRIYYRGDNILSILNENYTLDFEIWWRTKKIDKKILLAISNFASQENVYVKILSAHRIICTISPNKS